MTLLTNRYNQITPSTRLDNGCVISTPVYVSITVEVAKQLLNSFRVLKQKELIQVSSPTESLNVITHHGGVMAQCEQELGLSEEALRSVLYQKGGISEKIIVKLQNLTGIEVISPNQIIECNENWVNHLFGSTTDSEGSQAKKAPRKKRADSVT